MDKSTLLHSLNFSDIVINRNLEGINHQESLIKPQPDGHNFNWVLGHIVRTRNEILQLLGKEPLYPETKFDLYSPKEYTDEKAVKVEELREAFNRLQKELKNSIESIAPEKLQHRASLSPEKRLDDTVGSILATILWHEAYHAGQLGIIRRLVGKPGVIKNPQGE
ncbi:MAG TPA: DinB family protein [Acidobacteriota bacterium]|nr:DinB family protein [Acidobacteriota bacterium]